MTRQYLNRDAPTINPKGIHGVLPPMPDTSAISIKIDRVAKTPCPKCLRMLEVNDLAPLSKTTCVACQHTFTIPAVLGQFKLTKLLKKSAWAWVFEGEDTKLQRSVVVQVLRHDPQEKELFAAFIQQARALAQLNHPNIAQLLSIGTEKDQPILVTERLEGQTLEELILEQGQLDERYAITIILNVITALSAGYSAGVVHGDVNTQNIVIASDGSVKLRDLGIGLIASKHAEAGKVWSATKYVSPELIRALAVTPLSDMYSVGAILFHLLAGQPPFARDDKREAVVARLREDPPRLDTLRHDLNGQTVDIVAAMLARKPENRYQDYDSLYEALYQAMEGEYALATEPQPQQFNEPMHPGDYGGPPRPRGGSRRSSSGRDRDYDDYDQRPRRRRRKNNDMMGIVIGIIVLLGIVGLVIAMFFTPEIGTREISEDEAEKQRNKQLEEENQKKKTQSRRQQAFNRSIA